MKTLYHLVEIVILVAIGQFIWQGLKLWWDRRRYPYRFTCDRCGFTFKTNIRETLEISKSSHNHISTEEYK